MCILIDACILSKVFNPQDAEHSPFRTLAAWITEGSGSIVYGGSEYKKQLGTGRYLELFTKLRAAQRAFPVDKTAVDERERILKKMVPDKDFDDAHILAIIGVSKCCLLGTTDVRLRPYFYRRDLYPRGLRIPKVYTEKQGSAHCSDSRVVGSCPRRPKSARPDRKPRSRKKIGL